MLPIKKYFLKYCNLVGVISSVLLLASLGVFIFKFAVNIPNWDEYKICLIFISTWQATTDLAQQLSLIYAQANGHRIVLYQLLLILEQYIWGEVNFIRMIIVGNVGVLLMWFILWKVFGSHKNKIWFFLPITMLLLAPSWSKTLWGCSSFFYNYVNAFAFIALYYLDKESTKYFLLAAFFSLLASYTFGNGIAVYPTGVILLLINKSSRKKMILWVGFSLLILGVYFIDYTGGNQLSLKGNILFSLKNIVIYVLIFVGAVFKYFSSYLTPFFGGIIIMAYLTILWLQKHDLAKASLLWSFIFFVFASIGMAALSRANMGIGQGLSSRYELLHVLVVILLLMLFFQYYQELVKIQFALILLFSVSLYGARLHKNYEEAGALKERLETGLILFFGGDSSHLYAAPRHRTGLGKLLERVEKKGFYKSPRERLLQPIPYQKMDFSSLDTTAICDVHLEREQDDSINYFVKGWARLPAKPNAEAQKFISFKPIEENNVWLFKAAIIKRPSLSHQYGNGINIDAAGFKALIPKKQGVLPNGEYELGIVQKNANIYYYNSLERSVTIKN